ncbi:MAG: SusC/RagA family TonB-linked outer membrane protein [Tidjanibacter sp.]|nr:SusC/RagA family TonB-linked outer membrane protein [Tidjanibacter sp.]
MRKTLLQRLILVASVLLASTSLYAQRVEANLNFENQPLSKVLSEISAQTNYNFIYDTNVVDVNQKVSVKTSSNDLTKLLNQVFAKTGIEFRVVGKQVALSAKSARKVAQGKQLVANGIVYDTDGQPVVGASVVIERTMQGVSTNREGRFHIEVKMGDVLQFSYMGLKDTEVIFSGQKEIKVTMLEDSTVLDDIVVTGYQTISREKVTGSVVSLSAEALEERFATNVLDNLEGRVAGLMTYNGGMQIRGISSIHAERTPLLVVDGMPVEMSIEDLNPYDIENVTVLKDAAAAAIYGARASNGILVVTTKRAREAGKTNVDVQANFTVYDKLNIDYHDNFYMNAEEQVNLELGQLDELLTHPMYSMYVGMYGSLMPQYSTFTSMSPLYMNYWRKLNGLMTEADFNAYVDMAKKNNYAQEFADNMLQRQIMQQYNIAIRNRTDHFQSNLVFNYRHDNTGVIGDENDQFNIFYKGSYNVGKWLTANIGMNTIISSASQTSTPNGDATNPFGHAAYESLYDANGELANLASIGYTNPDYVLPENYVKGYRSSFYNPLQDKWEDRINSGRLNSRLQGELIFRIIDGLTVNTQFLYEMGRSNAIHDMSENSVVMRQMRNAYTVPNPDGTFSYLIPENGGYRATQETRTDAWTGRGQLNFDRSFGKLDVNLLAGLEFRETLSRGTMGMMLGYDDQLQSHATTSVDYPLLSTLTQTPYFGMDCYAKQIYFDPFIAGAIGPVREIWHRYASGYANLTLSWDEKYHAFGSYRSDYADIYGLDTKFRGTPLWSAGASWNLEKEEFMQNLDFVNTLKARVSYGITGNIYQGATSYMTAATGWINEFTLLPYGMVTSPANPSLTWEKTATTNFGVDFSLLGNRISGSLDFYHKNGTNLFADKLLEDSNGFSSMAMNAASMVNDGVELTLHGDVIRAKAAGDFNWSMSGTFSYNRNEITEVENPSTKAYELASNPFKTGYPASAVWALRHAGLSDAVNDIVNGSTHMYWKDKECTVKDNSAWSGDPDEVMEFMGQSDPKVAISWENRLSYKGFSLSAMLVYYGGHVQRMRQIGEQMALMPMMGLMPVSIEYLDAWHPVNNPDETRIPGGGYYGSAYTSAEYQYADIFVHDASFIKIRNIVLGYELPQSVLKRMGIGRANLSFQIDNPKPLWVANELGVDPETGGIARTTSYILGLNINF